MSAAAIARRRAAAATPQFPPSPPMPPSTFHVPSPQQNRLLTLQEVISLTDSRLTLLEQQQQQPKTQFFDEDAISNLLQPHLDEFNHRYEILASEILNLKNVVMNLQSYTLEVNKMMVEERIRVLSDPLQAPPTIPSILIHDDDGDKSNLCFAVQEEHDESFESVEADVIHQPEEEEPVVDREPEPVVQPEEPEPVVPPQEPEPVVQPEEENPVVQPEEEPVVPPQEPEPVVQPEEENPVVQPEEEPVVSPQDEEPVVQQEPEPVVVPSSTKRRNKKNAIEFNSEDFSM